MKKEFTLEKLMVALTEPIEYPSGSFYYLQLSKTRCWYCDLEGSAPDLHSVDTAIGNDLLGALKRMKDIRGEIDKELSKLKEDKDE